MHCGPHGVLNMEVSHTVQDSLYRWIDRYRYNGVLTVVPMVSLL